MFVVFVCLFVYCVDLPPFGGHGSRDNLHGVEGGGSVDPRWSLVREEGGTDGIRQIPVRLFTKCTWGGGTVTNQH